MAGEVRVFTNIGHGEKRLLEATRCPAVVPGSRLGWEIVDLIDELAVIFGRPVDLVARRSVHPLIRETVLSEAKEIPCGVTH